MAAATVTAVMDAAVVARARAAEATVGAATGMVAAAAASMAEEREAAVMGWVAKAKAREPVGVMRGSTEAVVAVAAALVLAANE